MADTTTQHEAADFRVGQQVTWLRPLGGRYDFRGGLLRTPATVESVGPKRVTIVTERGTTKRVERRQLETAPVTHDYADEVMEAKV